MKSRARIALDSGVWEKLTRNALEIESKNYPIPVNTLRVWDAPSTVAPGTPAADDLGVIYNTFKTAGPSIETGDVKTTSSTRKTGFQFRVPEAYVAGEDITLRVKAGMKTTVADTSCALDAEVTNDSHDSTADICATAAQSINSLTPANKDFTITGTNIEPGDLLTVVLSIAYVDGASGTAVIGKLTTPDMMMILPVQG